MADEANAGDIAQFLRQELQRRGAPMTAENLNRLSLAYSREGTSGAEGTELDLTGERRNPATASRRATGTGNRRATFASDEGNVPTRRGDASRGRPGPDPGNTATRSAQPGQIENKPPETPAAGDGNRTPSLPPLASSDLSLERPSRSDPFANKPNYATSLPLEDRGTKVPVAGVPRGSQPETVPGTNVVSGSTASPRTVQESGTGTAQAATVSGRPDVEGTPDRPSRAQIVQDVMSGPGADLVTSLVLGMGGRGFAMRGNPFAAAAGGSGGGGGGTTPASGPLAPRGPDAAAYPMDAGGPRIVQLPQLSAPPMPQVAGGMPTGIPGGGVPSGVPAVVPRPVPTGNPNMASPPSVIRTLPERGAIPQGTPRPIGQPRIPHDPYADAKAESVALGQELRARAARRGRNVPAVGDTTR